MMSLFFFSQLIAKKIKDSWGFLSLSVFRPDIWQTVVFWKLDRSMDCFGLSSRFRIILSAAPVSFNRVYAERAWVPKETSGNHTQNGPQEIQCNHVQQNPRENIWYVSQCKSCLYLFILFHLGRKLFPEIYVVLDYGMTVAKLSF